MKSHGTKESIWRNNTPNHEEYCPETDSSYLKIDGWFRCIFICIYIHHFPLKQSLFRYFFRGHVSCFGTIKNHPSLSTSHFRHLRYLAKPWSYFRRLPRPRCRQSHRSPPHGHDQLRLLRCWWWNTKRPIISTHFRKGAPWKIIDHRHLEEKPPYLGEFDDISSTQMRDPEMLGQFERLPYIALLYSPPLCMETSVTKMMSGRSSFIQIYEDGRWHLAVVGEEQGILPVLALLTRS